MLGDRPVDALLNGLARYLADHPKPTFVELLAGLADAADFALEGPFQSIDVVSMEDKTVVLRVAAEPQDNRDLTGIFVTWYLEVEKDYRRQVDRGPRASEALKTLQFILRDEPEEYIADPASFRAHHARVIVPSR